VAAACGTEATAAPSPVDAQWSLPNLWELFACQVSAGDFQGGSRNARSAFKSIGLRFGQSRTAIALRAWKHFEVLSSTKASGVPEGPARTLARSPHSGQVTGSMRGPIMRHSCEELVVTTGRQFGERRPVARRRPASCGSQVMAAIRRTTILGASPRWCCGRPPAMARAEIWGRCVRAWDARLLGVG
jgi:hypothetical protein